MVRRSVALVALTWIGSSAAAAGQAAPTKVSYDVELSTLGSLLDRNCTATGTDVLAGTLVGLEPAEPDEDNEYVGTLTRTTRITICGIRRNASGEDVVCSMSITGNGFADVVLTVYAQGRGGWLKYLTDRAGWAHLLPPPPVGPVNSVVNGTCEPAEMAELQADYPEGQTAGSPSGQPIEVAGLPTTGFPVTFPPRPPESIWTLKVLARRP
jgi:hypothetical protein